MKLSRFLHLWLSVPFGVLIVLICFSGATLVFEKEITEALHPELYKVTSSGAPRPLSEIVPAALASLPDSARAAGVEVSAAADRPYKVNIAGKGRRAVLVDQYTGRVLGESVRPPFFKAMHSLHGSLMFGRPAEGAVAWGSLIVGTTTLVLLIVLITGLVLWWPRSRRSRRRAFRIPVRKGAFPFWFALHDAGGMYVSLFLMAMCVTGLTWSFDWFSKGYYALLGASGGENVKTTSAAPRKEVDYALWDKELEQVRRMVPEQTLTVAEGEVKASLGAFGNARAADVYKFEPGTDVMTGADRYSESPRRVKVSGWTGSLHNGSWGGLPMRIIYMLAALAGAILPLTGYYLWLHRLRRRA